ncbi:MAG: hypothetical protein AB9873_06310 [Syntrophobacteraceae bacterium]
MTESDINKELSKSENGLRRYCWIQEQVHKNDVSTTREFQKTYNGFYRVRRNAQGQSVSYKLMEEAKIRESGFQQMLLELKQRTGRLESSFASKLVATLHPDRPVIDKFVLEHFGLSLPHQYETDRELKAVKVYQMFVGKYAGFMSQHNARVICDRFTARYPWADITDLKKVDLVLWQSRKT